MTPTQPEKARAFRALHREIAFAASDGSAPKPFSRSTETGSSVAPAIVRTCSPSSSSVTLPSGRPSVKAKPELVEEIRAVCEAVGKPVNVLARPDLSLAEIGSLAWTAVEAMATAVEAIRDAGDLSGLAAPTRIREWLRS